MMTLFHLGLQLTCLTLGGWGGEEPRLLRIIPYYNYGDPLTVPKSTVTHYFCHITHDRTDVMVQTEDNRLLKNKEFTTTILITILCKNCHHRKNTYYISKITKNESS